MKKKLIELNLNAKQRLVNYLYRKEGPSDYVLEKQVKINQQRNKHDISDKTKRIYKEFVQ